MPDSGGWYEQSPETCEAFGIIDDEINKVKAQEQKREEMKMKRHQARIRRR